MTTEDPVVNSITEKYISRSKQGMAKYKTTMADNPGDLIYWIDNAIEELMDATLYLERTKREILNKATEVVPYFMEEGERD